MKYQMYTQTMIVVKLNELKLIIYLYELDIVLTLSGVRFVEIV